MTIDTALPRPVGPRLPTIVQTALYWTFPRRTLRRWQARYGDVIAASVLPMGDIVFLCDVGDIKELMRADPALFPAGVANAKLGGPFSEHSMLISDGPRHTSSRALLMPAFHGRAVRERVEEITGIVEAHLRTWPVDRPFALHGRCEQLALDVILRIVMGVDERGLDDVRAAMLRLTQVESLLELFLSAGLMGRLLPFARRRQRVLAESHDRLVAYIQASRNSPGLAARADAAALLMRATDEDGEPLSDRAVEDQLITLLIAGYETTATALAWTFERLVRTPDVLARATRAAAQDDDEYLDAVVKESLRARTVIPDLSRMATADTDFAGHRIRAGVVLAPCLDIVHESPEVFDEPMRFRPERFLSDRGATANWLPFGGGIRRCLGAAFAQTELRTIIKQLLRYYEFIPTSAPDERMSRRHITTAPGRGAVVTVRARTAVSTRG